MQAPIVNQIYVNINSNFGFLVAIVHLEEDKVKQFAQVNNLDQEMTELLDLKEVEICVLE